MTFLISLVVLAFMIEPDPSPGFRRSKKYSENMECRRLSAEAAAKEYPGEVPTSGPRGDYVERSALVCTERMVRKGLRGEQDEAILSTLDQQATELASFAAQAQPELAERTWLVEVFYPSSDVSSKVDFAAKDALVGLGLPVTDRAPVLGVADVQVLSRMEPANAYPAACERYVANGSVGEDDVLLALVLRDPRETALHAGLCVDGGWLWVR